MTIFEKLDKIKNTLEETKGLISNVAKSAIVQYNIAEEDAMEAEDTENEDKAQTLSLACWRVKERIKAMENELHSTIYYLELAQMEQQSIDNHNL